MTDNDFKLFEILRNSLWSQELHNERIPNRIREELQVQAVEGLTASVYQNEDKLKYKMARQFLWMARIQEDTVRRLQSHGIPVAVIKGTASGIYYPEPFLRTYGDIDLLVPSEHYTTAIHLMLRNGFMQKGEIGSSHTALYKGGYLFELHQRIPGLESVTEGKFILHYILSGLDHIQTGNIKNPNTFFPMLPWQQHGLELIWHFRAHLYNGIGLRHVIDWMMFVHHYLDDAAFLDYQRILENAGLLILAKTVTRMCQLFLGLEESITWCRDAGDELCTELMDYILGQGNFGKKRQDDKTIKVLSNYRTPKSIYKGMQNRGLYSWEALKKYPFLRPFAWLYVGIHEGKKFLFSDSRERWLESRNEILQRREFLIVFTEAEFVGRSARHI